MKHFSQKIFRPTISICHECYKRIPAGLYYDKGAVFIEKICPNHGKSSFMVERDAKFFNLCAKSNAPTIYGGYFIDITSRCNLKCKYCYRPNETKQDPSIESIYYEALINQRLSPFILTGGEPTLRNDLCGIVNLLRPMGQVVLVTNGTGITESNIDTLVGCLDDGSCNHISLSIHQEADNMRVIDLFREKGYQLDGILWVIDDVNQIYEVVDFCENNRDVITQCRIKAATNVWGEDGAKDRIFVSDMLRHIEKLGAKISWWADNKVSFVTTELNGIFYMLVSWYDKHNIDFLDINCSPYYKANNGETLNLLTSMVINEGLSKGYMDGVKI